VKAPYQTRVRRISSPFNDATAIVLFTIVLAAIGSGVSTLDVLFLNSVVRFLLVLLGGLLTGSVVGLLGGLVVRFQKDNFILHITISLMMAYISFIAADQLHVSGVMSTMAAGIVVSLLTDNVILHDNHHSLEHFWEFFSFVANSFVFLLLGLTEAHSFIDSVELMKSLRLLLIAIPAVTLARAMVVYMILPVYNLFVKEDRISFAYQTILFWGGLRGAVPVALVLVIPTDFPGRDNIVHITLGYTLFTLLFQGTTVKGLMKRLKIKPDTSYFDYHKGVSYELTFPTEKLLDLDHSVSSLEEMVKSPEMSGIVKEEGTDYTSTFNFSRYLKHSQVAVSLKSTDKKSVITELVDLGVANGVISDRNRVLDAVLEREASMSTGFENGVAIPHAKCNDSDKIRLVIGISKSGIKFDSLDGKPAQIFFLVISPKTQVGPHIQLLAEIGRKMSNPDIREQLLAAEKSSDVISILKQK
jgi:mannitol/fructose-specific phosphotransferase system IIA component (Ntr-type)